MFDIFIFRKKNSPNEVQALRERVELPHLEQLAVAGKISRQHIASMVRVMNCHLDEVTVRIPDSRRPARCTKAMEGLCAAEVVTQRATFDDHYDNN